MLFLLLQRLCLYVAHAPPNDIADGITKEGCGIVVGPWISGVVCMKYMIILYHNHKNHIEKTNIIIRIISIKTETFNHKTITKIQQSATRAQSEYFWPSCAMWVPGAAPAYLQVVSVGGFPNLIPDPLCYRLPTSKKRTLISSNKKATNI